MALRRSGRERRPNPAFKDSADILHLLDKDASDASDGGPATAKKRRVNKEVDNDFQISQSNLTALNQVENPVRRFNQTPVTPPSLAGSGNDDDDENLSDVFEGDDVDEISEDATGTNTQILRRLHNARQAALQTTDYSLEQRESDQTSYSSAVEIAVRHSNHASFFHFLSGQNPHDTRNMLDSMRMSEGNLTIPSRGPSESGSGGMRASLFVTDEERAEDARRAEWYEKHIASGRFMKAQELASISAEDARKYTPTNKPVDILAAPNGSRGTLTLESGHPIHLNQLWPPESNATKRDTRRRGFVVNAGDSVHHTSWLPAADGNVQYLAVASRPDVTNNSVPIRNDGPKSSFVPGESRPSCIQVWKIEAEGTNVPGQMTPADSKPPYRFLALCADYGHVKDFKWAPIAINSKKGGPFGVLAMLHDDGVLRIFTVDLPKTTSSKNTQFLQLRKAGFSSRPPRTICTCIEWISPYLIAAGCANGHVAAWDIQAHFDLPNPPSNALPFFYHHLHDSFVLGLSVCRPSNPHLIISTGMDGRCCVTDLRSPDADVSEGPRHRQAHKFAIWHEHGQAILTFDDGPSMRIAHLRRIMAHSRIARMDAAALCAAASPVHGSVLVGCADGTAFATNPVISWFRNRSHPAFRQMWFKHEWRPGRKDRQGAEDTEDGEDILNFPEGLTRLATGFKLQNMQDLYKTDLHRGNSRTTRDKELCDAIIIHDKQTAVRSMAWNPNTAAGGWATAGMGNGLLWVEDLAWG